MPYRVLLAAADPEVAEEFAALALEAGDILIEDSVLTAGELIAALQGGQIDVIVLHEDLGPLPVLDLARELAARVPEVGLLLLARDQSPALAPAALRAGFRGIIPLPLSLESVTTTVSEAGAWAQAVRAKFEQGARAAQEGSAGGRMLAIAGAKGGVGTTTVAVQLALLAASASPPRSVCLVDFDLQTGDVRSYLDLTHRRSVSDLVEVANDLTGRHIEESLYVHSSGLRVLLPPVQGEYAETVVGDAARKILGGIRTRFDLVLVDVGAVVSEGAAVATEMADQVVVVATPDVPAMRAANRLLALWDRLKIRKDGVGILVNRVSRDSEIQPELVAKVTAAPVLRVTIPADFRALEAAANTGVAERLEDGRLRRAIGALAEELQLATPRRRGRGMSLRSSDGQVATDFAGMLLPIGLVLMLMWQLALAGYTVVLANHGAREAARELAVTRLSDGALDAHLTDIVRSDLPAGWDRAELVEVEPDGEEVRVTLTVPALAPSLASPWRVSTEAGTVREVGQGPPAGGGTG